jgi:imidazolonepropionase-like amidohydrolase
VCEILIPEVANRKLASAVDIFVEKEAWQISEAEQILECAKLHGLAIKLHSDQFHCIGGLELGVKLGALSVDHLEASGRDQIKTIAASATIATILPGVSLHLGIPAAPGRNLIDAGAAVAVGTDLNPGSSPLFSTAEALAFSIRLNGLTAQEAIVAGTINSACALGLANSGRLEVGCPADFLVLHGSDWRELVYTLGANPVHGCLDSREESSSNEHTLSTRASLFTTAGLSRMVQFWSAKMERFIEAFPKKLTSRPLKIVDLPGKALLPGFVNVHSHSFQRLIRGKSESRIVSGKDFWSWRGTMYHAASQLDPQEVYDVARMAFLEMVLAGTTTVGEFHYLHNAPNGRPYDDPNSIE